MTLDQLMMIVDATYPDGLIQQYYKYRTDAKEAAPVSMFGDGLAAFIVNELIETFDPQAATKEQLDEAARCMIRAEREIKGIINAFDEVVLAMKEVSKYPSLYQIAVELHGPK